jgi:hypothetical protein
VARRLVVGAEPARHTVTVEALAPVEPIASLGAPAPAAPDARPAALVESPPPPPPAPDDRAPGGARPSAARTIALAAALVGFAASLGAGAMAWQAKGVIGAHCDANKKCDQQGLNAASEGHTATVVSDAAFVVGLSGLSAWAVLRF